MDEWLLREINGWTSSTLIAIVGIGLSSRWMLLVVLGPVFAFLVWRRRMAVLLSIALAMGASDVVTARLLKPAFQRIRPCRALTEIHMPDGCGPGPSFPSGHAAISFAFLTSAAPVIPAGWLVFAPLAASVAGSRVLLGVHYPSDVMGGAVVGALIGLLFGRWRRRFERLRAESPAPTTSPTGGVDR